MLAERDVALEVIRELAGYVDVRTTQIYVEVTDERESDDIAALVRERHRLAHAAGSRDETANAITCSPARVGYVRRGGRSHTHPVRARGTSDRRVGCCIAGAVCESH
ncbi:MAG: hypothetical protein QOJ63_1021, partial [Solirubrobacteraceae bacterium]|nr:hypothetical protein [Solirubrobacteraceae bacterium]